MKNRDLVIALCYLVNQHRKIMRANSIEAHKPQIFTNEVDKIIGVIAEKPFDSDIAGKLLQKVARQPRYTLVRWFPEWCGIGFSRASRKAQPALQWSLYLGFWILIKWKAE